MRCTRLTIGVRGLSGLLFLVCLGMKVVKLRVKVFGLQTRAESWGHAYGFRAAFATYHRRLWCWLDEWWGMSVADVRAMEEETRRRNAAAMGGG